MCFIILLEFPALNRGSGYDAIPHSPDLPLRWWFFWISVPFPWQLLLFISNHTIIASYLNKDQYSAGQHYQLRFFGYNKILNNTFCNRLHDLLKKWFYRRMLVSIRTLDRRRSGGLFLLWFILSSMFAAMVENSHTCKKLENVCARKSLILVS